MERRFFILKAIVESFIESAEPVGSHTLVKKYNLSLSPATIRNEMAVLEHLGLIHQPFTSAGRVPTDLGFRVFVDDLMDQSVPAKQIKKQAITQIQEMAQEEKIYNAVSLLARVCDNVSFATLPNQKNKAYYIGLANILRKPEFMDSARAYTVVKVLEDSHNFVEILSQMDITERVKVFIGNDNVIPEIKSCSIIATTYALPDMGDGIIGILGPVRMNYPFNIGALKYIRDNL